MPELPEVETIKQELSPGVTGRCIIGVTLDWEGIVASPSPREFVSCLKGQCIDGIDRRGKYLLFRLSGRGLLIIHLKMSGALLLKRTDDYGKYVRAVIHLDDGSHIVFRDPRKFGRMRLADYDDPVIAALGPEPLEDDFTVSVLKERLSRRNGPIKAVLLDQPVIAGIGNMYADEALFASRIHPLKQANRLCDAELKRLYKGIRGVLKNAIDAKGASVNTYMRPDGQRGTAHQVFKVAHRRGENCPDCGGPIERRVIRGRGSYFCPRCQRV